MNNKVTQQFFADLCQNNPLGAHTLMNALLQHPTGGQHIIAPKLIDNDDLDAYYRGTEAVAKKLILKPRANSK